jgi:hypothetical protein
VKKEITPGILGYPCWRTKQKKQQISTSPFQRGGLDDSAAGHTFLCLRLRRTRAMAYFYEVF